MRIISVQLPEMYLEALDELVKKGIYKSRSEAIRIAVRDLLWKELWSKHLCKKPGIDYSEHVIVLSS